MNYLNALSKPSTISIFPIEIFVKIGLVCELNKCSIEFGSSRRIIFHIDSAIIELMQPLKLKTNITLQVQMSNITANYMLISPQYKTRNTARPIYVS